MKVTDVISFDEGVMGEKTLGIEQDWGLSKPTNEGISTETV